MTKPKRCAGADRIGEARRRKRSDRSQCGAPTSDSEREQREQSPGAAQDHGSSSDEERAKSGKERKGERNGDGARAAAIWRRDRTRGTLAAEPQPRSGRAAPAEQIDQGSGAPQAGAVQIDQAQPIRSRSAILLFASMQNRQRKSPESSGFSARSRSTASSTSPGAALVWSRGSLDIFGDSAGVPEAHSTSHHAPFSNISNPLFRHFSQTVPYTKTGNDTHLLLRLFQNCTNFGFSFQLPPTVIAAFRRQADQMTLLATGASQTDISLPPPYNRKALFQAVSTLLDLMASAVATLSQEMEPASTGNLQREFEISSEKCDKNL